MVKYFKNNGYTLAQQYLMLKKKYSNIEEESFKCNTITMVFNIKPTENSDVYKVKLICKENKRPEVLLLSPKLCKYNNHKPHHIYGLKEKKYPILCLYYGNEWNKSLYIADTIVPWISTWLFAYEIWQLTGKWHYDEHKD